MEEKNCEILFEYLKDIIYDSENAKLDFEQLDEPFRKLGMGFQYLDKAVKEICRSKHLDEIIFSVKI